MLEIRKNKLKRMLQESRFRQIHMYSEFALPLYEMTFIATKKIRRISTDGCSIYFDPDWLQQLGPKEMDFILSHQLMHIALGHISRPSYFKGDKYHLAANIVANANLTTLGWLYSKFPHIGKIYYQTFLLTVDGRELTSQKAIRFIPFDPAGMEPSKRRQWLIDSDERWDQVGALGVNDDIILSPGDEDPEDLIYDGATYGGSYKFKKEYFQPLSYKNETKKGERIDVPDHGTSGRTKDLLLQIRKQHEQDEYKLYWSHERRSQLDWRKLLNVLIREEINDYSFTPPDRRMQDNDFFLPDFNVPQETVKDILFMVDTSASISEMLLSSAYSEIRGAIEQFDGALTGSIAFFDTRVWSERPFESVSDLNNIHPSGGGGTDYGCLFDYIKYQRKKDFPAMVVIISDGGADFPSHNPLESIPTLWLLTNPLYAPSWVNASPLRL